MVPDTFFCPARPRMSPESEAIPTRPGVYWFQPETMPRALMVEVRVTNGELMVQWLTRLDEPVANLKGWWCGPIPPSSEAGSARHLKARNLTCGEQRRQGRIDQSQEGSKCRAQGR